MFRDLCTLTSLFVLLSTTAASAHHPFRMEQIERRTDLVSGKAHQAFRVTFVQDDRIRIDALDRLEEAGGALARGTRWIEIVRLDKGLAWQFDKTSGGHTERRFSIAAGVGQRQAGLPTGGGLLALSPTGERREINGQSCERHDLDLGLDPRKGPAGGRAVGTVWIASAFEGLDELASLSERLDRLGLGRHPGDDLGSASQLLARAGAALDEVGRRLLQLRKYPMLVEAEVFRPGGRRVGSIWRETKGVYPTMVFCSCTDPEKLFEFWGGFISLQIPLFQEAR